jgi:hypothetical protein
MTIARRYEYVIGGKTGKNRSSLKKKKTYDSPLAALLRWYALQSYLSCRASIKDVNLHLYPEQKIHHAAPRVRAELAH